MSSARNSGDCRYGDYLDILRRQDHSQATAKVEAVFEQAVPKYGASQLPYGDHVGDHAKRERLANRHLAIGKEAPEIDGPAQDGAGGAGIVGLMRASAARSLSIRIMAANEARSAGQLLGGDRGAVQDEVALPLEEVWDVFFHDGLGDGNGVRHGGFPSTC